MTATIPPAAPGVALPSAASIAAAVRPTHEVALRLFEKFFLHRKSHLAFLAPWGKPCPTEPGEDMRAALLSHLAGPAAPEFRAKIRTKNGARLVVGHHRIGAYCLAPGDTVLWLLFDLDGAGHASALADPLAAALATIAALKAAGITGHLERSGGGKGWHVWVFFEKPVQAAQARAIGLAFAPKDARLVGPAGEVADPRAGKGIEVFPKQQRLSKKGLGNQVWLPWWHGAPDGANLFFRQTATGDLEPYAPEDFETVAPELVERLVATIPVAPPKPTSVVGHDVWGAWRKQAVAAIDLTKVYGELLVGENAGTGWEKCRDPWSASGDQDPSAGVADGTGEAERGWFHSFRSDESFSIFDFLMKRRIVADFSAAMAHVAELSGVPLPKGAAAAASTSKKVAAERGQILLTDLGNARRLAQRHGHALRHCSVLGWLVWDGRRWRRDDTGAAMRLAKDTAESIWDAVKLATGKMQEELADWALVSQTASRLNAMLTLAATEEQIAVAADAFDRDPWLLNVLNGTIDLRTGALSPHDPKNGITKLAPVMYDPAATCPRFLKFLADVFEGSADLTRFVQKALGYALTGDVSFQVLFFLHGEGSNGKSTLITVVLHVLGDYASPAAPDILLSRHGERHPTELADLFGKRLVTCVEVGKGRSFNEALLKWLTGGDRVKARFMRADFFEFEPTHKIFICANNKPRVKETDHAFWRRMRLVPFNVRFRDRPAGAAGEPGPGEKDPFLVEKLKAEAPGILRWMVEGALALRTEGLAPPRDVEQATEAYRKGEDVLGTFLDECCVLEPDSRVLKGALYDSYVSWARIAGEHVLPMREFRKSLLERGITDGRMSKGAKCWIGVGLAATEPRGDRVTEGDPVCRMNSNSPVGVGRHTAKSVTHGHRSPLAGSNDVTNEQRAARGAVPDRPGAQDAAPPIDLANLDLTQFEDDGYEPACSDDDALEAL